MPLPRDRWSLNLMSREHPHILMLPGWYPTPQAPLYGIFFYEQAKALHREGVQIGVVHPEVRGLPLLFHPRELAKVFRAPTLCDEGGVPTVRRRSLVLPNIAFGPYSWIPWTWSLIEQYLAEFGRPDVIHVQSAVWPSMTGETARLASRIYGIPYVVTEHSSAWITHRFGPVKRWHIRRALNGADALVAVSHALAERVSAAARGRSVEVVPNLVDTDEFVPSPKPRVAGPAFRFATVAGMSPEKGLDLLVRAFVRAFAGDSGVVLEIAGDGPARDEILAVAREVGAGERVKFLGALTRRQVREFLWTAEALVLPSRVETFGVVLIEAMATGLPVLATRCGGPQDIVTPQTGLLVAPGDVDALAEGLRQMRAMASGFDSAAIRASAVTRYGIPAVVRQLLSVYEGVLSRRGTTAASR